MYVSHSQFVQTILFIIPSIWFTGEIFEVQPLGKNLDIELFPMQSDQKDAIIVIPKMYQTADSVRTNDTVLHCTVLRNGHFAVKHRSGSEHQGGASGRALWSMGSDRINSLEGLQPTYQSIYDTVQMAWETKRNGQKTGNGRATERPYSEITVSKIMDECVERTQVRLF